MDTPSRKRTHQPENFGANVRVAAEELHEPRCEAEVIQILNRVRTERIRVIGRLHSWSDVIQADSIVLDLRHLDEVTIEGDRVHIGGGCQIKKVLEELKRHGKTLPSVGFIAEQSIAGAISTGTHGSGRHSLYISLPACGSHDITRSPGKRQSRRLCAGMICWQYDVRWD